VPGTSGEPLVEYRATEDGVSVRVVSAAAAAREMARIAGQECPWCESEAPAYLIERDEDGEAGLALICPACEEDRGWASSGFFGSSEEGGGAR
jgi:hypothetical protein